MQKLKTMGRCSRNFIHINYTHQTQKQKNKNQFQKLIHIKTQKLIHINFRNSSTSIPETQPHQTQKLKKKIKKIMEQIAHELHQMKKLKQKRKKKGDEARPPLIFNWNEFDSHLIKLFSIKN
ncbi:hypothetical protein ACOSQ3_019990 [Xanthoceras sorbifolium]